MWKLHLQNYENKTQQHSVKTSENVSSGFVISVCYLTDVKSKENQYYWHRAENYLYVFVDKIS